jgi:hypothetical protein
LNNILIYFTFFFFLSLQQVVGYFDFKRENPPELGTRPSFRMSSLFRELNKWTIENIDSNDETLNPITMMVLRQYHSENKSILNNTYSFYANKDRQVHFIYLLMYFFQNLFST